MILALSFVANIGSFRIRCLLDAFPDPADIFTATENELLKVEGVGSVTAAAIRGFDAWERVDRILGRTDKLKLDLVSLNESRYPVQLRQLSDAPPLLWVAGNTEDLCEPSVAVVGTRRPDRYGRRQARQWAGRLSENGLNVVSGLALGIDAIAHREVLERGGRTLAVLGSGLDRIYPAANRGLAGEIVASGGTVCTAYPPGTEARAPHFPVRNRIVSGLCLGVLIIQSGVRGGSMITARTALDQSREVFVVPHGLDRRTGGGNHELIRSGQGKLVERTEDLLSELTWMPTPDTTSEKPKGPATEREESVAPEGAAEIFRLLEDGEQQIEHLSEKTGRSLSELMPLLTVLELDGWIRQRSGKYFSLPTR